MAFSGFRAVEMPMLENVKQAYRALFKVEQVLELQGCICCSKSCMKNEVFYSPAGEREYLRTGLCEYCFDVMFAEDSAESGRIRAHVTPAGQQLMEQWVMLSKARVKTFVPEAAFRFMVEMACGLLETPQIYQS